MFHKTCIEITLPARSNRTFREYEPITSWSQLPKQHFYFEKPEVLPEKIIIAIVTSISAEWEEVLTVIGEDKHTYSN